MKTIINLSNVIDYSSELPVVTYSNSVTTLINDPTTRPIMPIIVPCPTCENWRCNSCQRRCNCNCQMRNCCGCNQGNF